MLHIFTDGACPSNGKGAAAKAAYAVVFWNIPGLQEPLILARQVPSSEPQTNQRAELRAIHSAFQEIQERNLQEKPAVIWTDSDYARRCITEWAPLWKARGWRKTQSNKSIEHLDLLKPMIDFYEKHNTTLQVRHVEAHTKKTEFPYDGNAVADKAAAAAAINA